MLSAKPKDIKAACNDLMRLYKEIKALQRLAIDLEKRLPPTSPHKETTEHARQWCKNLLCRLATRMETLCQPHLSKALRLQIHHTWIYCFNLCVVAPSTIASTMADIEALLNKQAKTACSATFFGPEFTVFKNPLWVNNLMDQNPSVST